MIVPNIDERTYVRQYFGNRWKGFTFTSSPVRTISAEIFSVRLSASLIACGIEKRPITAQTGSAPPNSPVIPKTNLGLAVYRIEADCAGKEPKSSGNETFDY